MKWETEAYAITRIGADHIKMNKVCQDYSLVKQNKKWTLIAVSDGHGGKEYVRSQLGSRFACEAVLQVISENPPTKKSFWGEYTEMLKERVLQQWKNTVEKHIAECPFSEEELRPLNPTVKENYLNGVRADRAYGCTLGFALITNFGAMYGLVGDSECYVKKWGDELYKKPLPEDADCRFNITTSMCSSNALEKFRCVVSKRIPRAVFLMSDGVVNSFATENYLTDFLKLVETSFGEETETEGKEAVKEELSAFISDLSKKGSGDDVSLACVFCHKKVIWDYMPFIKRDKERERES